MFRRQDRGVAVGAWSGLGGVASAIGPVLGGVLVGATDWGWRLVFVINVPLAAAVLMVARRFVPETRDDQSTGTLDVSGAVLASLGLAALTFGLTEGPAHGWRAPAVAAAVAGAVVLAGFVTFEGRRPNPLVPLGLFRVRQFAAANAVTFVVYAALSTQLFLLPVTVVMLLLSPRMGALASRIGPRLPMTVGPLVAALGQAMLVRVGPNASYLTDVLPAVVVFALGLSTTVAPLTTTVLDAAPDHQAGVASAINNDIARVAGLLAVAVLPGLAGITPRSYDNRMLLSAGFDHAVLIAAGLCALGGALSASTIRRQ